MAQLTSIILTFSPESLSINLHFAGSPCPRLPSPCPPIGQRLT
jgi:hypothetical protein